MSQCTKLCTWCLFFLCLFLKWIRTWSTSQIIKQFKSHHVNYTDCQQDVWAVHFIKQLLSAIFGLVSLVLGNFIGEAHFSKWKKLQGLEFERDLWLTAWSEKRKKQNKTVETLSAWSSFRLFSYSVAYHAVSPCSVYNVLHFDYFTCTAEGCPRYEKSRKYV